MKLKKVRNTQKNMAKNNFQKGEIAIYKTPQNEVELRVKLKEETVWLSLDQMAFLFNRDKSVISRHIKNIFQEKELEQKTVVANFATTASDGKTYQVDYYNLDVIISIGYRVKSQNGVRFRIWATNTLKKYLIKGYAINKNRLLDAKNKFNELMTVIKEPPRFCLCIFWTNLIIFSKNQVSGK
ncbi:MAG: RhuM family protein [Patescibacteria group bacterium]|nr:RhuM family protein [Patescibacteria group bacterium]